MAGGREVPGVFKYLDCVLYIGIDGAVNLRDGALATRRLRAMLAPMPSPFPTARFLKGAPTVDHSPPDQGAEIAVAGRSNAGKSSTINALLGIRKLARTSKTPGCTRQLNFFDLGGGLRLVDLPGYGYARAPAHLVRQWPDTLAKYLRDRRSLRGLLLVMDIRHPLSPGDRELLARCREAGVPVLLLLNKSDKVSRSEAANALHAVAAWLRQQQWDMRVQLFSARTGQGIDQAQGAILEWAPGSLGQKNAPDRG
jgi:GTP-binding protein